MASHLCLVGNDSTPASFLLFLQEARAWLGSLRPCALGGSRVVELSQRLGRLSRWGLLGVLGPAAGWLSAYQGLSGTTAFPASSALLSSLLGESLKSSELWPSCL